MTKSIFVLLALTTIAGCSTTNVYENDDGDGGSAGDSSTASSTSTSTGGSGSNTGSTSTSTGGSTSSPSDVFAESCSEAGSRIMTNILESYTFLSDSEYNTLLAHDAYGTMTDVNGNALTCSTCPTTTFGGAAFWVPGLEKTNNFVGDAYAASFGGQIKDRFSTETYANMCGDGCVSLVNIAPPNFCGSTTYTTPVLCAASTATPTNCTTMEDNSSNAKASLLCCNSATATQYLKISTL